MPLRVRAVQDHLESQETGELEGAAFKEDGGARAQQHLDSDQVVKRLRSLDENIDQLGEEVRQRECKMMVTNSRATGEEGMALKGASPGQTQAAPVQSLMDTGPTLEKGLVDFKLESPPSGEENLVPNFLELADWNPAVIGMDEDTHSSHEELSTLEQQYEQPALKKSV